MTRNRWIARALALVCALVLACSARASGVPTAFHHSTSVSPGASAPIQADLDQDGVQDGIRLRVGVSPTLTVALSGRRAQSFPLPFAACEALHLTVGDIDSDGDDDIVVWSSSLSGGASILRQGPGGSFRAEHGGAEGALVADGAECPADGAENALEPESRRVALRPCTGLFSTVVPTGRRDFRRTHDVRLTAGWLAAPGLARAPPRA